MAYAYNDCFSGVRCGDAASRNLTVVTKLISYINANLAKKISLETLAKEVNYSEYYICHLFKQATNRTITSYILEKRIERATSLLRRSVPINKAAEQAGFSTYSHFYKMFKKQITYLMSRSSGRPHLLHPPSMNSVCPVIPLASSEARKHTPLATS